MARIRSLKYEFFISEELAQTTPEARLLGLGLTTLADREGRLEDRPLKIKVLLFPYHNTNVDQLLDELQTAGFISRYTVENKRYIQITNFAKHQRPHPKEPGSTLPAPLPTAKRRGKKLPAAKKNERSAGIWDPGSSGSGIWDLGNGEGNGGSLAARCLRVFEYWKERMAKPKAQLTPDRKKKIEERLADSTVEEIFAAVDGCKASDFHMGRQPGKPEVHNDIELICRKRSKVEQFIEIGQRHSEGHYETNNELRWSPTAAERSNEQFERSLAVIEEIRGEGGSDHH